MRVVALANLGLGGLLLAVACSEPIDPDTPGSIKVTVTTTGEEIDPDGYTIYGALSEDRLASNGSIVLDSLTANATIEVRLADIAPNCSYTGPGADTVMVQAGRRASVTFALACVGPLVGDLVFSASVSGPTNQPGDIYAVNLSGLNFRNLTMSPGDEFFPVWNPDGSKIAFTYVDLTDGRTLFVMDPDGSNRVDLNIDFTASAWSPDGTRLVGVADAFNLYLLNSDGTGLTQLTDRVCIPGAECGTVFAASWSPDGSRIVYVINPPGGLSASCNVINVDGTGGTQIKEDCAEPSWSPDGSRIAYTGIGSRPDNLRGHLFVMNPDGSGAVDLTLVEPPPPMEGGAENFDGSPSWSTDGTQIAFLSRRDIPEDPHRFAERIFVMNADGTGVHPVRTDPAFVEIQRPAWQPRP
jgi:Tol biopolymer transport system component